MSQPHTTENFINASSRHKRSARTVLLRMAEDEGRAARIRELRKDKHLRWKQIAEYVGVELRSAQMWQETGSISYENAKKLAELAGVDVDYIMRGARPMTPDLSLVPDPPPADADERMKAMENRLMEQADIIRGLLDTQNGLLARQSGILERIENAIAREEDVSKRLAADGDEWADRLLARLEEHRAETQTQGRAPKVPAKSGTRRG